MIFFSFITAAVDFRKVREVLHTHTNIILMFWLCILKIEEKIFDNAFTKKRDKLFFKEDENDVSLLSFSKL